MKHRTFPRQHKVGGIFSPVWISGTVAEDSSGGICLFSRPHLDSSRSRGDEGSKFLKIYCCTFEASHLQYHTFTVCAITQIRDVLLCKTSYCRSEVENKPKTHQGICVFNILCNIESIHIQSDPVIWKTESYFYRGRRSLSCNFSFWFWPFFKENLYKRKLWFYLGGFVILSWLKTQTYRSHNCA